MLNDQSIEKPNESEVPNAGKHPLYRTWQKMKRRCHNPQDPAYCHYGARGVIVCERWYRSFANFVADMGPKPSPGHSLDRKDNDGSYSPENCRWATTAQQCRNRRNNIVLEFGGRKQVLTDWAQELGLPVSMVNLRIRRGWSVEKALTTPASALPQDRQVQSRNKKNNVILEFQGRRQIVTDWARELGLDFRLVFGRLNRGWSAERALTTPLDVRYSHQKAK